MPATANRLRGLAVAAACVLAVALGGTASAWAHGRSVARPAAASLRHIAWMPGFKQATVALAKQSGIPMANLTLVARAGSYAHNDPAGAYPHNAFFTGLVRFLETVRARG